MGSQSPQEAYCEPHKNSSATSLDSYQKQKKRRCIRKSEDMSGKLYVGIGAWKRVVFLYRVALQIEIS